MRRWLIGLTTIAVLTATACTGQPDQKPRAGSPYQSTPSDPRSTAPKPGTLRRGGADSADLRATVTQYRLDEGTRKINAQLTNRGTTPVTVTGVRLSWAGAGRTPTTPKDTVIAPGQTIDLRTTYGPAYCRKPEALRAGFHVTIEGGEGLTLAVDRAGLRLLERLRQRDCAARQLREMASISFGPHYRQVVVAGEELLRGSLIVRRVEEPASNPSPVYVEDLLGSVLLSLRPVDKSAFPAELPPGDRVLSLPVFLGSTHRCDAHALSQSTQTFLLSVLARVGHQPTQRVIVSPNRAVQRQAGEMLDRVCE